jgi:hypothetical protein
VIEHRRVRRDQHGVLLREVGRAGRQLDPRRLRDECREEDQAVRDRLVPVGQVLADERVVEAEPVGEDHGLAFLGERVGPAPARRVERHREVTESHLRLQGESDSRSPVKIRGWGARSGARGEIGPRAMTCHVMFCRTGIGGRRICRNGTLSAPWRHP